jgi:Txe/YoeB family toxin of Txe-Axe toxin-antitoxin module
MANLPRELEYFDRCFEWTKQAKKDCQNILASGRKSVKNNLIKQLEIIRNNPLSKEGIGDPHEYNEPTILNKKWTRDISKADRILFDPYVKPTKIISCLGHPSR